MRDSGAVGVKALYLAIGVNLVGGADLTSALCKGSALCANQTMDSLQACSDGVAPAAHIRVDHCGLIALGSFAPGPLLYSQAYPFKPACIA